MSRMPDPDLARLAAARPSWVARWVAGAFTPGNVVAALTAFIAVRYAASPASALGWWAVTVAGIIGAPYAILGVGLRTGRLSDRQVVRRAQRPMMLAAAMACIAGTVLALWWMGAPQRLVALVLAMLAALGVVLVATLRWKVSGHVAVVSGAVAVLTVDGPAVAAVVAAAVVPVVAWARWRDGRHSAAQLLGGAVIGFGVAVVTYGLLTR